METSMKSKGNTISLVGAFAMHAIAFTQPACASSGDDRESAVGSSQQTESSGHISETKSSAPRSNLLLGIGSLPEYEGADEMQLVPLIAGRIYFNDERYLEPTGTGARLNLLDSKKWAIGPSANFLFGRDDDIGSDVVAALGDVDDAIEFGGFVSRTIPTGQHGNVVIDSELLADVSGTYEGYKLQLGLGYGTQVSDRFSLAVRGSVTFADDDYAETYFSVSPMGSDASGLPMFDAEGGLKDFGVGLTIDYRLTEKWSVGAVAYVSFLVDDFEDSPIVDVEGESTQVWIGIGLGRRF